MNTRLPLTTTGPACTRSEPDVLREEERLLLQRARLLLAHTRMAAEAGESDIDARRDLLERLSTLVSTMEANDARHAAGDGRLLELPLLIELLQTMDALSERRAPSAHSASAG